VFTTFNASSIGGSESKCGTKSISTEHTKEWKGYAHVILHSNWVFYAGIIHILSTIYF
jgi:hypothetical protein